jgi:hypothetical protein
MKKIVKSALATLAAALVLSLAACGPTLETSSETNGTGGSATPTPEVTPEPEPSEPEAPVERQLPPGGTLIGDTTWFPLPTSPKNGDIIGFGPSTGAGQYEDYVVAGSGNTYSLSLPSDRIESAQVVQLLLGFPFDVAPDDPDIAVSYVIEGRHMTMSGANEWSVVCAYGRTGEDVRIGASKTESSSVEFFNSSGETSSNYPIKGRVGENVFDFDKRVWVNEWFKDESPNTSAYLTLLKGGNPRSDVYAYILVRDVSSDDPWQIATNVAKQVYQ